MPEKNPRQATIIERLDYTLQFLEANRAEPRAIYLCDRDKRELDKLATKAWGSGSPVKVSSHRDTIIVNREGVEKLVPLREFEGQRKGGKQSAIYSTRGVPYVVRQVAP